MRFSAVCLGLGFVLFGMVAAKKLVWAHEQRSLGRHSVNDAIVSCLQREGTPMYGVGPAGVPSKGQPLTADHVVVVCVEEKR